MKGDHVRKKIRLSGIRLNDIAVKMGVSPQALNNILNADDVRTGSLERIADAMNVPITYFYGDGSIMATDNAVVRDNNNHETQGIIVLAEQLSIKDKQIDRLLGIIENFKR